MDQKLTYRIRNWSDYNKALVQRGSLNIWFEGAASKWCERNNTHRKGRPRIYSDDAILCALIIRAVYHLPLRALQGFLIWIFSVMSLGLPVPCYTCICRRAACIGQKLTKLTPKRPTDIVFDSTGVKVYGEGEWKVRQHGKGKRRTWRKIHLAICPNSHEMVLSELSESAASDAIVAGQMLKKLSNQTERVYGDGAFDQEPFYKKLHEQNILPVIPPRKGGQLWNIYDKPWMQYRNEALHAIWGLGNDENARSIWKKLVGYHTRSLVETAMFRFKKIFGENFRSKELTRQKAELYAKFVAMNKMTKLGMPKGCWIAS